MSGKPNKSSPLVTTVLTLQDYLSDLERIGAKLNGIDLSGEVEVDHIQKLLTRFAECGQGISEELNRLGVLLTESRLRAESIAEVVAKQAEVFRKRQFEEGEKLERFRALGDRARELNAAILPFTRPQDGQLTGEEQTALLNNVQGLSSTVGSEAWNSRDLKSRPH